MTTTTIGAMRGMSVVAALVALLLGASAARAQGEAPREKGDEPSLITQGVALRLQGHDEAAFEVFSHAWERFHTPRAQAQLGLAAQALGRWVVAETHLAGALQSDDPWVAGKRKTLEDALVLVRKRLGSLEVLADVEGAEVLVDGQVVGKLPLATPLRLPAGTAVVQVQAKDHVPLQRSVMVEAGQLARETFRLVRLTSVVPAAGPPQAAAGAAPAGPPLLTSNDRLPPPPPASGDARRKRIFYSAIGLTVVGAGLTTWSGIDTLSARDRYVERPTEDGYRDGVGRERRTNLLLIGTGLVAASALAWALITDWGAP